MKNNVRMTSSYSFVTVEVIVWNQEDVSSSISRKAHQSPTITKLMSAVAVVVAMLMTGVGGSKVLMVSMNGFRADYIHKVSGLVNFESMAKEGCSADYMEPSFVTENVAAHYTLATGLYQESHGIVGKTFYDPEKNDTFHQGRTESFWWDGGEPLWVTAEKANKKTGVYFWAGSEAEIRGVRPSDFFPYNKYTPFQQRLKTSLEWLKTGDKDLVMVYFNEPDITSHDFGPDKALTAEKVREMDYVLGQILNTLKQEGMDYVNLIVVSGHGMTNFTTNTNLLDLWDYVNKSHVQLVPEQGAVTHVLPKEGEEDAVVLAAREIPHVTVYRKEEIPEEFHLRNSPRIPPVLIVADEGWLLANDTRYVRFQNRLGEHGFSNNLTSMHAIFMAWGPDFIPGAKTPMIRAVDVYPLVCHLLGIEPAPNNGSLSNTALLLRGSGVFLTTPASLPSWIALFGGGLFWVIAICERF